MIKLGNSVKVFVPVNNNNGVKVDLSPEILAAVKVIEGATTYPACGSWVDNNQLYTDDMNVMQFNLSDFNEDAIQVINNLIYAIFTKAEQLAVSVEINGTLYILENTDDIKKLF